ncbi:MAG: HAD family hydrolase [Clostridiales bacterium]|nr:HAD family hydrolase [Clostridiales bacterium]
MGKFDGILLVSDIDATLFNSQHRISEENKKAIDYFKSEGGKFTVASGRMRDAVGNYFDDFRINAPAILHNGAVLYDFDTDTVLYKKTIEPERKQAIFKVAQDHPEFGIEIYSDERVYIMQECFETERFKTKNYDVTYGMPDEIWDRPWTKALIVGTEEELDAFEPIFKRDYDSGYSARSGKFYLDIVANDVSKGYGVRCLAKCLKINRENIYAVGDNMNDYEMIEYAGNGFAVENAVKELKKIAKKVVPSNDDSAIAYIIYELINSI